MHSLNCLYTNILASKQTFYYLFVLSYRLGNRNLFTQTEKNNHRKLYFSTFKTFRNTIMDFKINK